jgi:hypothetical protein
MHNAKVLFVPFTLLFCVLQSAEAEQKSALNMGDGLDSNKCEPSVGRLD